MNLSGFERSFLTLTAVVIFCTIGSTLRMTGADMFFTSILIAGAVGGIITK